MMANIILNFHLYCDITSLGDKIFVTGNITELGYWNEKNAKELFTNKEIYPYWSTGDIILEINPLHSITFEYKYFLKNEEIIIWENFQGNRILKYYIPIDLKHSWSYKIEINGEIFNHLSKRPHIKFLKAQFYDTQPQVATQEDIELEFHKESNLKYNDCKESYLDSFLSSLEKSIEEIKQNKFKIKEKLITLFKSFKSKKKLDLEFLILIFLHFFQSGQLKNPEKITEICYHNHHHDSILARSLYTYLLSNVTDENSILIKSILSYIPICMDYRVIETER